MKNIKKILSSILISAMILINFTGVVYASEVDAKQPTQDNLTYETTDNNTASMSANPEDTATESTNPDDTATESTNPEDTASEGAKLEDTASEGAKPEDTATESTNPDDTASMSANPEDTASEGAKLEDTASEGANPEDIITDDTNSDEPSTGDYEIYVDEQGQVYYIEKEPEEVVVEEATDLEKEEEKTTEEADEAKKAKKDKKAKKSEEKPSYSEKDLRLLACLVYSEAGNQSYEGMLAVANVVLNRAKSDVYFHVDTIKEVIYDRKWAVQFAVTVKSSKSGKSMMDRALKKYDTQVFSGSNPKAEKKAMNKAIKAAKAALMGKNNIGDYLCFNAVNKRTYKIKNKYPGYKILGDHIFYRTK